MLALKFLTIVKELQVMYNQPMYWLMVTTPCMVAQYRKVISSLFEMDPVLLDARYLTEHRWAATCWGNIPNMHKLGELYKGLHNDQNNNCLTDNMISMQGNDKAKNVDVQEIERLYGYPAHYTDAWPLNHATRRRLLGNAWDVHAITRIL
ncbi:DNM3A-like protein, partial [Mya arenaria]